MDDMYNKQVAWILRQEGLTPAQLKRQYVAYKDQRGLFEDGYGTVEDMTALITPGVKAMLDLEDQMLADFTAARQVSGKAWMYYLTGKLQVVVLAVVFLLSFAATLIVMAVT